MTRYFKYSKLYSSLFSPVSLPAFSGVLAALILSMSVSVQARAETTEDQDVTFNTGFIKAFDKSVDISRFEKSTTLAPGDYQLDIYINDQLTGRGNVRIAKSAEGVTQVCFPGREVAQWGLNLSSLSDTKKTTATLAGDCVDLSKLLPDSQVQLDPASLAARISIPQIFIAPQWKGYVSPDNWENGVNAGFVSYSANSYMTTSEDGNESKNVYVNLNSGLNILGWRLRHNGALNVNESPDNSGMTTEYNSINTYAQHDVTALESTATVGQFYTPGDMFDSVPFVGVQLANDERMMADAEKGFAPEIRGIADTNAKVTVRQGSQVVYETSVAPGPFQINDLTNTGYSGDLNVTITEADGRTKNFVVPYASVSQLLRPGISRFSATAGQYYQTSSYSSANKGDAPKFIQGTYRRGISNHVTGYGGGIVANDYVAALGGFALNTELGAFAFDVTNSVARSLPQGAEGIDESMTGQSYRVAYSKLLTTSNTNLALAAYRFSSAGYLTLQNVAQLQTGETTSVNRPRERMQLNISQPVGGWGNIYVSGLTETSWNKNTGRSTTYQAGYGTSFAWGTLNVTVGRTYSEDKYDNQIALMYSLPLGRSNNTTLTNSINHQNGNTNYQSNLSGTAGQQNQLTYNTFAGYNQSDYGSSTQFGGSADYKGSLSDIGGSVSRSNNYTQYSATAKGTILGYRGGVVLTPQQGETMAIVEAKGASGAEVIGGSGATVGWWGTTAVTSLTPYKNNNVLLDPHGMSADVELQSSSAKTVPRYGAITVLKFDTIVGKPLLVRGVMANSEPVPFGADVLDKQNKLVSMVGQNGQILLRGLPEKGSLTVKWGDEESQRCQLIYNAQGDADDINAAYQQTKARCN